MMEKLQTHGNLLIFSRLFSPQVFKIALFFFWFVCLFWEGLMVNNNFQSHKQDQ